MTSEEHTSSPPSADYSDQSESITFEENVNSPPSESFSDKSFIDNDTVSNEYDKCSSILDSVNGLRLGHLNVRSLIEKIDEIRFLLLKLNFDVLCLSETWLNDSVSNEQVCIDEYSLIRKDRNEEKRGGGVCMFIKKKKKKKKKIFTIQCKM